MRLMISEIDKLNYELENIYVVPKGLEEKTKNSYADSGPNRSAVG